MGNMGAPTPYCYERFAWGISVHALVPNGAYSARRRRSVTQWAIKAENATMVMSMSRLSCMIRLLL